MSEALSIMTLKDAAGRLGVRAATLRKGAYNRQEYGEDHGTEGQAMAARLGAQKIGRDWYVDRAAVEAEVERRRP